jgi:hypothetical protein
MNLNHRIDQAPWLLCQEGPIVYSHYYSIAPRVESPKCNVVPKAVFLFSEFSYSGFGKIWKNSFSIKFQKKNPEKMEKKIANFL